MNPPNSFSDTHITGTASSIRNEKIFSDIEHTTTIVALKVKCTTGSNLVELTPYDQEVVGSNHTACFLSIFVFLSSVTLVGFLTSCSPTNIPFKNAKGVK